MALEVVAAHSPRAAEIWNALAAPSFFLSWGWIENWLASLPAGVAPALHVFGDDHTSAAFIANGWARQGHAAPVPARFLNTTGITRFDNLWIEYNGVVGRPVSIGTLARAITGRWSELHLPGLTEDALATPAIGCPRLGGRSPSIAAGSRLVIDRSVPAYYVALDRVRAAHGLLGLLSSQTRSQIRRAQRLEGELVLEVAQNVRHAIDIYNELTILHGAQWRARGQPGAFADPWFDRCHRRLIAKRFDGGDIQLVRVIAGGSTLGCLYNFVWRGDVLQYQSGFRSAADARHKPGLVCHTAAIEHCAAAGLARYDLLAGDTRYKKSLSTDARRLVWARLQRPDWLFAIEQRLADTVRGWRA